METIKSTNSSVYNEVLFRILHNLQHKDVFPVIQLTNLLSCGKIFDTDGQERFGCLPKSHYEGVTGAVLVYDLTNHRTFENIARWLTEINEHTDSSIATVLVGNKRDLEHSRAVHQEEAIKCASVSKIPFMETSAVDTTNVEKAFVTIIKKVHEISTEKQRVNGCSVQQ